MKFLYVRQIFFFDYKLGKVYVGTGPLGNCTDDVAATTVIWALVLFGEGGDFVIVAQYLFAQ